MSYAFIAVISILVTLKWGKWKNWKEYYPAILYFIIGNLAYMVPGTNRFGILAKRLEIARFWNYNDGSALPIDNHIVSFVLSAFEH